MAGAPVPIRRRVAVVLVAAAAVGIGSMCATGYWRAIAGAPIIHVYWYTDETGTFDEMECPEKGRRFDLVTMRFEEWKRRGNRPDAELHRTFEKEWEGRLGLAGPHQPFHPRWDLPYRPRPDED